MSIARQLKPILANGIEFRMQLATMTPKAVKSVLRFQKKLLNDVFFYYYY